MVDIDQMKEFHIVKYPHKVLRQKVQNVTVFDENLKQLVLKMIEIMHSSKGVGLAANQIGISQRIFVANSTGEPGRDMVFINGEITEAEGWEENEEGCLSCPDIFAKIRRNKKVTIKAVDMAGQPFEYQATDLMARVIQHESDHLDGRLIIDRMSSLAKMAHRRQIKYLEDLAKDE